MLTQFLFVGIIHILPFLDDAGDQLRLPHPWKLMPVLVIFLSRKLAIDPPQGLLSQLPPHPV